MTSPSLSIARHKLANGKTVSLSRLGQQLIMTTQPQPPFEAPTAGIEFRVDEDGPIWAVLSNMVPEDPFPGYSTDGNEMFWIKTYSENKGLLEECIKAGWLRPQVSSPPPPHPKTPPENPTNSTLSLLSSSHNRTGRTHKQAFVVYPMCELRLDEQALARHCPACNRYESILDEQRFKRCAKCHKRYYCQKDDWPSHKLDCKDLLAGRLAQVENRKRNETRNFFQEMAGPKAFEELSL
ncbi:BZ3500_MvSof-1268-A1-R1_Chr5-3g08215 [Microbotryum saponariae]|uniref:BZ3500_MvSof-1268-A1-R1_Chr5-3g08215 protein n=1 Tax=Microbotryum saponariae TaxID=289078 RepID=A0A2X0KEN9_9BASI|nr:BZ3500_MvSof-1268-A1-R1_Chr5-3g08215 [Microbotryum saponariae]SDA07974.1 BZ3501_MvSof-1269-A2-R1_Chr5-1g07359 [Microbotryum saponariae]